MSDGSILVTGASGLIGRAVLARLLADGRDAIGLDLAPKPDQVDIKQADLADIHRLHALAGNYDVTAVIHCGAVSGPMVMIDNPYGIIAANVTGTANIVELARIRRMRRLVFCSSMSAYGPTRAPPEGKAVTEDWILRPSSVYGATKAACELLIGGYRAQHGLDAVSIRLSWVYGPGRTTDCVIRTMIEDAQAGRKTHMPWGEDFLRQFVYVDDAVDALIAALDAEHCSSSVYNVTGGTALTLREVGAIVTRIVGGPGVNIAPGPDPLDDIHHRFDIEAIARDIGFRPRRSLDDGIGLYAAWLLERREK